MNTKIGLQVGLKYCRIFFNAITIFVAITLTDY